MALIEVKGTIKLEPTVIKSEPNAVEIYPDDVFHSSDEDDVKKEPVSESDNVNNNSTSVENVAVEYDDSVEDNKTFRATENLREDERLVINFNKQIVNDEGSSEKSKNTEKNSSSGEINWANAYRTYETTNCREDQKKVKNIKSSLWHEPIAPDEFTITSKTSMCCNHCHRQFSQKRRLNQHIKLHHRGTSRIYQCPYCPTQSKWDLRYHILTQHKNQDEVNWFQCYLCDKKFVLKSRLVRHIKSHLGEKEDRPGTCPVCARAFRSINCMRKHLKLFHGGEKNWHKCEKCSYTAKNMNLMRQHVEVYHTDPNDLPIYKCSKCDFKTRYKSKFTLHCKKHVTTYFCEKCAFTTCNRAALQLHMNVHKKKIDDESLKYHCKKCDYKTYRQYSLTVHELNHLKPEEIEYFYCYHCNFKAKRKDNLKTHIMRHFKKEDVTLQCFICDYKTEKRDALTKHINWHQKSSKVKKNSAL